MHFPDIGQVPDELAQQLPEEIQEIIAAQKAEKTEQVNKLGQSLAKKRDNAIKKRQSCDIEEIWQEDEEQYAGVDNANRSIAKWLKGPTPGAPLIENNVKSNGRSCVFINITAPYTDAYTARIADMLLPVDDKNYAIHPSPIPELPAVLEKAMRSPDFSNIPPAELLPIVQQWQQQTKQVAERIAEQAEKQIDDWLTEGLYNAEVRKVLEDAARLGTGVLKGPIPKKKKAITSIGDTVEIAEEVFPSSRRISAWNIYPDPACGDNIHNGAYIWERDFASGRVISEMVGLPGYLEDQIKKVLEEGPRASLESERLLKQDRPGLDEEKYEIWYYHGFLDKEDVTCLGVEDDELGGRLEGIPVSLTIVNESVIRCAINPLDSGEFPYDVFCLKKNSDNWWGEGIPRMLNNIQRMLNSSARAMMDNAGLSAGPLMAFDSESITPADGEWAIRPYKVYRMKDGAMASRDIRQAITFFSVPSNQPEMMNIINFCLQAAEQVTGLPLLMQGQNIPNAPGPETFGGMQLRMNNASTTLRRIAKAFDDFVTTPHLRRYGKWLQQYGPDECKGDLDIVAVGSSALIERDVQAQAIFAMGQLVLNPAFGLDPAKWMGEWLKAQRLDPMRFSLSDEQKQQASQQPPPVPPQVQVAQINAQAALQRAQMTGQIEMQKAQIAAQSELQQRQMDVDRDTVYVNAQNEKAKIDYAARVQELQLKREIAAMEGQIKRGISLEESKTRLAETVMKLQTQQQLAVIPVHQAKQVTNPATEPPGRAPNGEAFQR